MSKIIEIIEENNELRLAEEDAKIVCGNSNYKLKFVLSEDWQNANHKAAVFCVCGKKTTIAFAGDECEVPVLHGGGVVFVSLFAGNGEVQLATTDVKIELVETFSNVDFVEFEPLRNDLANLFGAVNDIENGNIEAKRAKTAEVAEVANNVSNPNLLINGDFRVNQRGQVSYAGNSSIKYFVDRWFFNYSSGLSYDTQTKTLIAESNGSIVQYIEDSEQLLGKTLTLSCKVNGDIYFKTATLNSTYGSNVFIIDENIGNTGFKMQLYWNATLSLLRVGVATNSAPASVIIDYVKLEIGSTATTFCPRPYAEELALCQRYFQSIEYAALPTFYTSENSGLYCCFLTQSLRVAPTITNYMTANIRDAYTGNTLTESSLTLTYYGDLVVRFNASYKKTIEKQFTNLFIQQVKLDAEIY